MLWAVVLAAAGVSEPGPRIAGIADDGAAQAAAALADPVPLPGAVPRNVPISPRPPLPAWSVALSGLAGVADPFFAKAAVLASVRRRTGPIFVEVFGGRAFSAQMPSISLCSAPGACAAPAAGRLAAAPGRLDWMGGAGVRARVLDGKASAGGLNPLRFSLDAGLAAAAVGYRVRDTAGPERSPFAPGARLALGLGVEPWRTLALRAEFSSLLYVPHIRGAYSVERQMLLGASVEWHPGAAP